MTETEDRLTDALHAAARSVTAPALRPLDDALVPRHVSADPRQRRHRWLAAVASAAAVALIAGLAVAVSGHQHTGPAAGAGGLPRYYVASDGTWLTIRATATGRETAKVLYPAPPRPGWFEAAATADDRTFFALFEARGEGAIVYRFQVTSAGRISHLAPVPGGPLGHVLVDTMAVSPSGSQLAIAVRNSLFPATVGPDKVIVLSTRTGARTTWAGDRAPRGQDQRTLWIQELSWTANGRELVYLGHWNQCPQTPGKPCLFSGPPGGYEQVRTLNPAGRGGSLTGGRLLINAPGGYLGAAAISPDGRTLTGVEVATVQPAVSGPLRRVFRVTQFDVRTGRPLRVLYQAQAGNRDLVRAFVPGPAGQDLILITNPVRATVNGWIARHRLHRLAPAGSDASFETW